MKISVIIPAYNAAHTVVAAVDSALAQSYQPLEVIVVNDGSTDDTKAIAEGIDHPKLQILSQENAGASAARNRGYEHAQGDYLLFLDADDLLHEKKLEVQVAAAAMYRDPDTVFFGSWERFYAGSEKRILTQYPDAEYQAIELLSYLWTNNLMVHPATWLVPRRVVQKCGPWDESLSLNDDGEFFCRVMLSAKNLVNCKDSLTYYRSGLEHSLSGQQSPKHLYSYFRSVMSCRDRILEFEDSPRCRRLCADVLQRFAYTVYPYARALVAEAESEVQRLGGSDIAPHGGERYQKLCRAVGWKPASVFRAMLRTLGYAC